MNHSLFHKLPKADSHSAFLSYILVLLVLFFFHTSPVSAAVPAAIVVPEKVALNTPSAPLPAAKVVSAVPKARLEIPSIGVDAAIENMGLTGGGAMAVPGNNIEVGLYSLGTQPGEVGSAVIGGHNRWSSKPGVFARLNELKEGDIVTVVGTKGIKTVFIVRAIRSFDATDTNTGIFSSDSGTHLNLITCSGQWNPATGSYTKRLVIFTDLAETSSGIAMGNSSTR